VGIAEAELGDARLEIEPEEEPYQQKAERRVRRRRRFVAKGEPARRRVEEAEERGFEEEVVPLEREELAADARERKVKNPDGGEAEARRGEEEERGGRGGAGGRRGDEGAVGEVDPEERGGRIPTFERGEAGPRGVEPGARGAQAVVAGQERDLRAQRDEGNEVDGAEEAQEERTDPGGSFR
jgi:hypothetical protein